MDAKFTELFRFEKKEIDGTFQNSTLKANFKGLKLLQAPMQRESQSFGKILIIASRKTGKACKRNRIRRQIKSIFYEQGLSKTLSNFIILVYKPALDLKFEELKDFLVKNIK